MSDRLFLPTVYLFLYLQLLDILTTLTGFSLGVTEASPFIRLLVTWGPTTGLIVSKMGAVILAAICYRLRKPHLLRWINYWYAALILWNVVLVLRVLTAAPELARQPPQSPVETVTIQVNALRNYNQPFPNAGVWTTYQLASPANRRQTGPYGRFLQIVKTPANKSLLHASEWRIADVRQSGDLAEVDIVVTADAALTSWTFQLSNQQGGWLTDGVSRVR